MPVVAGGGGRGQSPGRREGTVWSSGTVPQLLGLYRPGLGDCPLSITSMAGEGPEDRRETAEERGGQGDCWPYPGGALMPPPTNPSAPKCGIEQNENSSDLHGRHDQ